MADSAREDVPQAAAENPEADAAVKPAAEAAGAGEAAADAEEKPDLDEVKRKFREALDAKRNAHADSGSAGGRDAGRTQGGARGPAGGKRSFRRKSG